MPQSFIHFCLGGGMFGVIGGTGLNILDELKIIKEEVVRTEYGETSSPLFFGELGGNQIVFLTRHGKDHSIPPHLINYQANIFALHSVGVKNLIGVATVGGIKTSDVPGALIFPHQLIDYTYSRISTFFDGKKKPVTHIDFTYPYNEELRQLFINAAVSTKISFNKNGVYAAVQGPRLETEAEINRYEKDGATIVGMTGMPEASLAKELGINYAAICPVANHAAGRGLSQKGIIYDEISLNSKKAMKNVVRLLEEVIKISGN
jgi:5'-methylthioinosine phosphorylase